MTTKKIDLYRDLENGSQEIVQKTIRPMKFRQLNQTLAIVLDLTKAIREDEALMAIMRDIWGEAKDKYSPQMTVEEVENMTDEELEELDKQDRERQAEKNKELLNNAFKSFETLLTRVPNQTLELIAAISNIDLELLLDQEIEDVGFEIIDAILMVNDFTKIIERGKQSLDIGKRAFNFGNKPQIVQ